MAMPLVASGSVTVTGTLFTAGGMAGLLSVPVNLLSSLAGQSPVSIPQLENIRIFLQTGSSSGGMIVTFQEFILSNNSWQVMGSPAPLQSAGSQSYDYSIPGSMIGIRLNVTVAGNGLIFGQITATLNSGYGS